MKKSSIINIAIALISLVSTLWIIRDFPDIVPTHFDQYGVADGWGSKYNSLIFIVIIVIMQVFGELLSRYFSKCASKEKDCKKAEESKANARVIDICFVAVSAFFAMLNYVFLYMTYSQIDNQALQSEVDITKITVILMGIMFAGVGLLLPKTKKNSVVGFRLGWTMYNDVTWEKSNRFCSYAMMIFGILNVICALFLDGGLAIICLLASLLVTTVVLFVYAYSVYKKERKKSE